MPRQITDIEGIATILHFLKDEGGEERPNKNVIYKLVRRQTDPLPHRKIGKHLRFDVERCLAWFDRQPGTDGGDLHGEE